MRIGGVTLGQKALNIYIAIAEHWRRHSCAPSLAEIAQQVPFGKNGPVHRYAIKCQVDRMKRAGIIDYEPGKARTIRIKRGWPGREEWYEETKFEHPKPEPQRVEQPRDRVPFKPIRRQGI